MLPLLLVVQVSLKAGVGYAFVVDGVGGASGRYIFRYCCMVLLHGGADAALFPNPLPWFTCSADSPISQCGLPCSTPSCSITAEDGPVNGQLPPASLMRTPVSVAAVGPSASASGECLECGLCTG